MTIDVKIEGVSDGIYSVEKQLENMAYLIDKLIERPEATESEVELIANMIEMHIGIALEAIRKVPVEEMED